MNSTDSMYVEERPSLYSLKARKMSARDAPCSPSAPHTLRTGADGQGLSAIIAAHDEL